MNKTLRILLIAFGILMIASGVAKITGALAEDIPGTPVPFVTSVELNDGAGNPVATLHTRLIYTGAERQVTVAYTLTNRGEHALTQLNYNIRYFDADGNDLRDKALYVMIGLMKEPLQPGESRDFLKSHYFEGAGAVASVELEPLGVKDEVELPPWTEPQPNNLLLDFCNDETLTALFDNLDANPPVELRIYQDEMDEVIVTDVDQMMAELEGFRHMRIGEPTDEMWCDAASAYTFTLADGREIYFSFNAPGIFEWHGKNYTIIND